MCGASWTTRLSWFLASCSSAATGPAQVVVRNQSFISRVSLLFSIFDMDGDGTLNKAQRKWTLGTRDMSGGKEVRRTGTRGPPIQKGAGPKARKLRPAILLPRVSPVPESLVDF